MSKHIIAAILLITTLLLTSCDQSSAPEEAIHSLVPDKLPIQVERGELSTAAATPGQPIGIVGIAGRTASIGSQVENPADTLYIRHEFGLVNLTDGPLFADVSQLIKADSSWRTVEGLAGSFEDSCFSFESLNFPGEYLRHFNSRIRRDAPDGSAAFREDATWCTVFALDGTDSFAENTYSFESLNFPSRYLRHYNGELWLSEKGGPRPSDTPNLFEREATWTFIQALINF